MTPTEPAEFEAAPTTIMARADDATGADYVMTEHPAWRTTIDGAQRVFPSADGGLWQVVVTSGTGGTGGTVAVTALAPGTRPRADYYRLPEPSSAPAILVKELRSLGTVARFRTSHLWEAMATAVIRQVIRARQSKILYRRFSEEFGEKVSLERGYYFLFPPAETVLKLDDNQFAATGMAFKRKPLRAAAQAYLDHAEDWNTATPARLLAEFQDVPGIGPWTAAAAVADLHNTWSIYPYTDLAVRTWARRAAPTYEWPSDEAGFGRTWRRVAGDDLGTMTLLTLAWGSQHGHIG